METRKKFRKGAWGALEKFCFWPWLLCLALAAPACRFQNPYPDAPGVLFIRQQICDLGDFKKGFFRPENGLKGRGFLAYSFHRDWRDPGTYILTFRCADLRKAAEFIQTSNFITACVGAGKDLPLMWAGTEEDGHSGQNFAQKPGGLVVARYEVKNYGLWKKSWEAGQAGNRGLPGSRAKNAPYGLYRGGSPGVVIAAYELPDMNQAREFMASKAAKDAGVAHMDFWIGTNLEGGTF